ncbi:MAG: hypothetical protein N2449_05200 [Bacteroidales bacterium]|nr:hypothetical protein [Bacteroidales bacterium]
MLIFSQDDNKLCHKKNVIKINPLGGIASAIPITIERFFIKNLFSLGGNYTYILNKTGSGQSTYNADGFIIMPQLRHYFYKDTIHRVTLFFGGYYLYEEFYNLTLDRYSNKIIGQVIGKGYGGMFGAQWFLKNNFVFDFFVGPGYIEYIKNEHYDNNVAKGGFLVSFTGPKNTGTKIKLGFSIGYSF